MKFQENSDNPIENEEDGKEISYYNVEHENLPKISIRKHLRFIQLTEILIIFIEFLIFLTISYFLTIPYTFNMTFGYKSG